MLCRVSGEVARGAKGANLVTTPLRRCIDDRAAVRRSIGDYATLVSHITIITIELGTSPVA